MIQHEQKSQRSPFVFVLKTYSLSGLATVFLQVLSTVRGETSSLCINVVMLKNVKWMPGCFVIDHLQLAFANRLSTVFVPLTTPALRAFYGVEVHVNKQAGVAKTGSC